MNNYMIFVDLSADMTIEFAKKNNIGFVPMQYSLGEDYKTATSLESDEDLKKFYDSQRGGDLTKTTQITPFFYQEFFKDYLDKGIDILYFTLSSGLSKTYESALLARTTLLKEYPNAKIEVIDSLAATGGLGVLAQKAVDNMNNGFDIEKNALSMREYVKKINHWFLVPDLQYLKRGGRVSSTSAFVGSALKIVPILEINKIGKLDTIAKKRGIKLAAAYLVEKFINLHDENEKCVYVCHADNIQVAKTIKDKLLDYDNSLDVRITMLNPIIGAHTGPGMCAICCFGK